MLHVRCLVRSLTLSTIPPSLQTVFRKTFLFVISRDKFITKLALYLPLNVLLFILFLFLTLSLSLCYYMKLFKLMLLSSATQAMQTQPRINPLKETSFKVAVSYAYSF